MKRATACVLSPTAALFTAFLASGTPAQSPLTPAVDIIRVPNSVAGDPKVSIARDPGRTRNNVLVLVTYQTANGDYNGFAIVMNDDFSGARQIAGAFAPSEDSRDGSACYVAGADRWVISYGHRIYIHDPDNLTIGSGINIPTPQVSTAFGAQTATELGGTAPGSTGDNALLVWSGNWPQSPFTTEALGALVNARTGVVGPTFPLTKRPNSPPFGTNSRSLVDVIPQSNGGTTSWIATWREQLILANDQWLWVSRIRSNGTIAGEAAAYSGIFTNETNPNDVRVAGRGGKYMIGYRRNVGFGNEEMVTRPFTWSGAAASPSFGATSTVVPTSNDTFDLRSLASNGASSPSWLLGHADTGSCSLDRVNSNGASLASMNLPREVEAIATVHGPGFMVVTAERQANGDLMLRGRLLGPNDCQARPTLAAPTTVTAGQNFTMFITKGTGMSDNTFSQFAFSTSTLPSIAPGVVSLALGASFSNLLIWPEVVGYASGSCAGSWQLPSFPTMRGASLHFQGWAADFNLPNIFPLVTTNRASVTFQ